MAPRITTTEFIKRAKQKHFDKYDYSITNYIDSKTNIEIVCRIHGCFSQRPDSHLCGKGCMKCSGKYKKTTSEFIDELYKLYPDIIHYYDFSNIDYKSSKKPVKIVCKFHGEFERLPEVLLYGHQVCPLCGDIDKTQEFIIRCKNVHGDLYDYSKLQYVNPQTKITVICNIHGEFQQFPHNHIRNGGCVQCFGNARSTTEEFITKSIKIHGNTYDYTKVEYKNNTEPVIIICKIHGNFTQRPTDHLSNKGCIKCAGVQKSTTEEFIIKATNIHGDKYDYSQVEYINNRTNVIIICKIHGEFEQPPTSHIHVKAGCPTCNSNKGEEELEKICNNHQDVLTHCKKTIDCIDIHNGNMIRKLIPDKCGTTINNHDFMIELDGPQHFGSVNWFGSEPTDFQDQRCRDLAKNKYAMDHGWSLLRISYQEYNDSDYWVNKFIQEIMETSSCVVMYSSPEMYEKLINKLDIPSLLQ